MNLSASTLRYRLIEGQLPLEPLRILAAQTADWQDSQITFCILGASHAVRLQRGDTLLTELLACATPSALTPIPLSASRFLLDIPGDQPQQVCRLAAGIVCQVELRTFALSEGDSLQGDFVASQRLEVAYPAQSDVPTPYTRLGWRMLRNELIVETVHTYPEENIGIRSCSRFRREEVGR